MATEGKLFIVSWDKGPKAHLQNEAEHRHRIFTSSKNTAYALYHILSESQTVISLQDAVGGLLTTMYTGKE